MNQNQAQVQTQAQERLLKFLASVQIPKPPNPICQKIAEAFRRFAQCPKKNIQSMKLSLSLLDMSSDVPHTKSRLCGGLLKKGDKAYKCHDCITEENSILCNACFDLDKHIGHQFERIDVFGGCCDCGDIEKWKQNTFCNAHSQKQQVQVSINSHILSRFVQEQHFAIAILFDLYAKFHNKKQEYDSLDEDAEEINDLKKKVNDETLSHIKAQVDAYGSSAILQLVQFNKTGDYAHFLTQHLFDSHPPLTADAKGLFGQGKYLDLIFRLFLLQSTPQKICDLCITMFSRKGFRKFITIAYINKYNRDYRFATSNYTHLSSQLFTSYMAISELLNEGLIEPIQFKPVMERSTKIQTVAEGFLRFYYDIMYLSKLYGSASSDYFLFHARNERFKDLAYYRMLFNDLPEAKDYYGLEDLYLIRMLPVIKLIQREENSQLYTYTLRELYRFITTYNTHPVNLYRSQQRLFTIIAFNYLQGDIDRLDHPAAMQEFISIIGVQDWRTELERLMSIMCQFLYYASKLCDNNNLIQSNLTLYSFYFRRSNMLFNLDSILLKIIAKIYDYFNKTVEQEDEVHYEEYIVKAGEPYNIFYKLEHLEEEKFAVNQQNIVEFVNYINLMSEVYYSDLPQLAISSLLNIQPKSTVKFAVEKSAYFYYQNILKSTDNSHISIKEFKAVCEAFFKEEEVFKVFANDHMDNFDNRKLDAAKSKGSKFSLQYFKSVNSKVTGINHNGSLATNPYQKTSKSRFSEIDLVKYAKLALRGIQLIPKEQLQKSKHSRQGLNAQVITELWKIFFQTHSKQIQQYFHQLANNQSHSVLQKIPHLAQPIIAYFRQHATVSAATSLTYDQMEGDKRRKEQLRRKKLQSKKSELNSKMKKDAELHLKSEQAPIEEESSQISCCICKEDKQSQAICFAGFLSISNFHGWFYQEPNRTTNVFNSCGHHMHRNCYKKTAQKNRLYNYCLLCKTPINLLLPLSSEQSLILDFQKDLIDVLKCLEITTETLALQLYEAAAIQIVMKGLLYSQQYKKELNLWKAIMNILKKMVKMNDQEQLFLSSEFLTEKNGSKKDILFSFVYTSLFLKLFDETNNPYFQSLNEATSKRIVHLVDCMFGKEFESMEDQAMNTDLEAIRQNIALPKISQSLSELSSRFLGKCPICSLPTNEQMICLICPDFVTCSGCSKMKLMQHSNTSHLGSCCFLKSSTGELVYIYKSRYWKFDSIYEDYMGRPYQASRVAVPNKKEEYKLVQKKIACVREDIVNNNIELKIRYKQKSDNKVFYDQNL